MPPRAVKSILDLIYWQYAKIISESAGIGKDEYGFVMNRFKKLVSGEINWSTSIREYIKEREQQDTCIYCGTKGKLTLEHILPRSRGGPDTTDNAVFVCKTCNCKKGDKRLYEWFGLGNKDGVPRIAEGKYLKLVYSIHENNGTLGVTDVSVLCPRCDLEPKCPVKQKLTVFCLEGICTKT
ncbi:MAG: HNH endonuclease [Candidatus Bathyarchaeia archaeon]